MSENKELKHQLIKELNENNEKERLERVEKNKTLKEITLYANPNAFTDKLKETLETGGIKYNEDCVGSL